MISIRSKTWKYIGWALPLIFFLLLYNNRVSIWIFGEWRALRSLISSFWYRKTLPPWEIIPACYSPVSTVEHYIFTVLHAMRLCNTPFDCLALHRKSISIDLVLINNNKKTRKARKAARNAESELTAAGLASSRRRPCKLSPRFI